MSQPIKLPLGKKIKLDDFDPDYMAGHDEGRRKMRKKLTKITNEIIPITIKPISPKILSIIIVRAVFIELFATTFAFCFI